MKLSRYEQEVVINFNADESEATVYTANPAWMRKMDKLCKEFPEVIPAKIMDGSKQDIHFTQKPCQDWETEDIK